MTELCLQYEVPATGAVPRLERVLQLSPFRSMILCGATGSPLSAAEVRPLIELAQSKGIASLIEGDAALVRDVEADGVHIPWSGQVATSFAEARRLLGSKYIAGADAGRSRHDAMTIAEAGADYIGFGLTAQPVDRAVASERRLDLTAWWAEIFEIPVMALDVERADEVSVLSAAAADFVAVRVASGFPQDQLAAHFAAIVAARSSATVSPVASM